MADPTVSASLNKQTYTPGEAMVLTVLFSDPDTKPVTIAVQVSDASGHTIAATTTGAVLDPLTVTVADPDRTWAVQSNNGATAVYTAVA